MSVTIPQPFQTSVQTAQPFRTKVEGLTIPDTYSLAITEIPPISFSVESLPTIRLNVENLPPVHFQVDPIEIRLTEIPSVRTHLPADFAIGFSLLGMELGTIRLCGEGQIITEPYRPNPCETCSLTSFQGTSTSTGTIGEPVPGIAAPLDAAADRPE
ncbi:MAG: hypothetical protein GEU90_05810 [Gemmatimonas sp.]|nr:hypothetical protein [Gemmatimonas sp.]